MTVAAGGTVRWQNESDVGHTATASEASLPDGAAYFASGGFDSEQAARERMTAGLVESGEEYQHTFDDPGTYEYVCLPHEGAGMVGAVRVR